MLFSLFVFVKVILLCRKVMGWNLLVIRMDVLRIHSAAIRIVFHFQWMPRLRQIFWNKQAPTQIREKVKKWNLKFVSKKKLLVLWFASFVHENDVIGLSLALFQFLVKSSFQSCFCSLKLLGNWFLSCVIGLNIKWKTSGMLFVHRCKISWRSFDGR